MMRNNPAIQGTRPGAGRLLPALAVLLLAQVPAGALEQRSSPPPGPAGMAVREQPRMAASASLDRVIDQIERRYQAKVVRVDQAVQNGRPVFVLRLLSEEGRVWTVRVDAATGRVL